MSSVTVEELKGINQKLSDLRRVMIGDLPENIGLSGQFKDSIFPITMGTTIADSANPKAAGAAGVAETKEYNVIAITSDGDLTTVSYSILFYDGTLSPEIEASQLRRYAGFVRHVQVNVDTGVALESMNVSTRFTDNLTFGLF